MAKLVYVEPRHVPLHARSHHSLKLLDLKCRDLAGPSQPKLAEPGQGACNWFQCHPSRAPALDGQCPRPYDRKYMTDEGTEPRGCCSGGARFTFRVRRFWIGSESGCFGSSAPIMVERPHFRHRQKTKIRPIASDQAAIASSSWPLWLDPMAGAARSQSFSVKCTPYAGYWRDLRNLDHCESMIGNYHLLSRSFWAQVTP